ncbi:MAG: YggT family protein [Chloroflexi bacterium]|nr:YggT family protein [Chloroflexota bacterium]
MAHVLVVLIDWIFTLYTLAIIARALLPWFRVDYYHPVMRFLIRITEPMLAPLRRHIRPMGGLDFTPMVAVLILWFVQQLLGLLVRTLLYAGG